MSQSSIIYALINKHPGGYPLYDALSGGWVTLPPGWCVVSEQQMPGKEDGRANGDGEHQKAGHSEAERRAGDFDPVADALAECSAVGHTEPPSHHHQPDADDGGSVGGDGRNKRDQKQNHTGKAHDGKPLIGDNASEAIEAAPKTWFHALFSFRCWKRVDRRGGGVIPPRQQSGVVVETLSTPTPKQEGAA